MTSANEPGGFLQTPLLSPPSSLDVPFSSHSAVLPRMRHRPLKPGSSKESTFIDYVDQRLLAISRRYEKRFNTGVEDGGVSDPDRGYETFAEMANDLENVHDVVWVSGTRTVTYIHAVTIC